MPFPRARFSHAVAAVQRNELDPVWVPAAGLADEEVKEEVESEEENELDVIKQREFGERKGTRQRKQARPHGFQLNSQAITMTEDSDN